MKSRIMRELHQRPGHHVQGDDGHRAVQEHRGEHVVPGDGVDAPRHRHGGRAVRAGGVRPDERDAARQRIVRAEHVDGPRQVRVHPAADDGPLRQIGVDVLREQGGGEDQRHHPRREGAHQHAGVHRTDAGAQSRHHERPDAQPRHDEHADAGERHDGRRDEHPPQHRPQGRRPEGVAHHRGRARADAADEDQQRAERAQPAQPGEPPELPVVDPVHQRRLVAAVQRRRAGPGAADSGQRVDDPVRGAGAARGL